MVKSSHLAVWKALARVKGRLDGLRTRFWYRHIFGAMGPGCVLRPPVMLVNPQRMFFGRGISVRHGARLEAVTEHLGKRYYPELIIGDDCNLEQNVHMACAERIVIGRKVAITENVGIFDILHPFADLGRPVVDQPLKTAPVSIGDETMVGMGAVIQPGVRIGMHCVVGANSVVTKNVPDYCVVGGVPARILKRYNPATKNWEKV